MDFFGEQRIRTRRSLLLYGLFFLIVLAHIAVALAVMGLLLTIFTGGVYRWVLILVIILTLGSFFVGSFLEYQRLRAGGRAIAQRVGGVRLFIDNSQVPWQHSQGVTHQYTSEDKVRYSARHIAVSDERDFPPVYRRYYEIAQQLAIASGLSTPILYVLPDEQGINGFVAGRHSQDMVLVVTQGALDKLSDEALYGLIGHEYGHILHGDATFNLKLMVVLAGLQILYDWSDPISNHRCFDSDATSQKSLSQRQIDVLARSTEAQTASFTTHSEWVTYWQTQSQQQQSSAKRQSRWVQNRPAVDRRAPRSIWTLLLHGLSFSSMASAQLIKHSFNRQRELLADATSVQLTRTPAILETLKVIHQDSLGSRLTGIADINGLSHFFFASSGADLGDVSWFATHPSLTERMSAINADAYHDFAIQVAKEKRLNQQKIKEIYRQRRLGNWGEVDAVITQNSLSNKSQVINKSPRHSPPNFSQESSTEYENIDEHSNGNSSEQRSISDSHENKNSYQADECLEIIRETDKIIDGRLQVEAVSLDKGSLLKPWQARPDVDLPKNTLIEISDRQKVSLPQYIIDHSHHPLGALALIETVMLCHQRRPLSTNAFYSLIDIWGAAGEMGANNSSDEQLLPHRVDTKLLTLVASVDRRLDSALIELALKQLRQHDLSESSIKKLKLKSHDNNSHNSHQYYKQQENCRTMLLRYQQGILSLLNQQRAYDVTQCLTHHSSDKKSVKDGTSSGSTSLNDLAQQQSPISSLWQALHLLQLLPILADVLHDTDASALGLKTLELKSLELKTLELKTLKSGIKDIYAQLDPSGQVFGSLNTAEVSIIVLLAYRLSKDAKGQMISMHARSRLSEGDESVVHYIVDLRRHARLIDIDLSTVTDANLQWLLLTAQHLNSIQLLAIIAAVPVITKQSVNGAKSAQNANNAQERQQHDSQIDYNDNATFSPTHSDYRQWLSTLHTVMLHDTIISQDEYDCLLAMAEYWLGVRELF